MGHAGACDGGVGEYRLKIRGSHSIKDGMALASMPTGDARSVVQYDLEQHKNWYS